MTIINGEYVQKAVFTLDPIDKIWTNGGLGQNADDAPARRPSPSPSPVTAPAQPDNPPAPPAPQAPASGRTGTRSGRS
jgi:hypothetical protein